MRTPANPRGTALAVAALALAACVLSACIYVDVDRSGYGRRPPPGYHGDGYHRNDPYRRW